MRDGVSTISNGTAAVTDVMKIGVEVGVGLRSSMSQSGIRQIADFVNGIVFAGLLLEKNYRTEDLSETLVETTQRTLVDFVSSMRSSEFSAQRDEMHSHTMGISDQTPTEMLVTAGMSGQAVISRIGGDYDLSRQEIIELVSVIIALAIASSTPDHRIDIVTKGMIEGIVEKTKVWDQIIPSDDEMYGDFLDDEGNFIDEEDEEDEKP